MKKTITTDIPAESGPTDDDATLVINLPETLSKRIQAEYRILEDNVERMRHQTDKTCRTLLEGFMAAMPETDGKNFNLSADKTALIEVK